MSLPEGGREDGQQQDGRRRRSVGLDGSEKPSVKATSAAATSRPASSGGGGGENAYPWLNAGAVGRPRSAGLQQRARARGGSRQRQWQKSATSHGPHIDPLVARRGLSLDGSADKAVPRSSSQDMLLNANLMLTTPTKAAEGAAATLPIPGTTQSQHSSPKHARSWRHPMGGGSVGRSRGRRRRGSSRSDGDEDGEGEGGVISFRDATLVAWLNSVLLFERNEERRGAADDLGKTSRRCVCCFARRINYGTPSDPPGCLQRGRSGAFEAAFDTPQE